MRLKKLAFWLMIIASVIALFLHPLFAIYFLLFSFMFRVDLWVTAWKQRNE